MKDLIALLMINKTEMGNSGEAVVISTTIKPGTGHMYTESKDNMSEKGDTTE